MHSDRNLLLTFSLKNTQLNLDEPGNSLKNKESEAP